MSAHSTHTYTIIVKRHLCDVRMICAGLFRSLEDDAKASAAMQNDVARSPELSGVTYVQDSGRVWGMPHMLRMVDMVHLKEMGAVLDASESCLRADAHEIEQKHMDCHVNVLVALTGPVALAGRLYKYVVLIWYNHNVPHRLMSLSVVPYRRSNQLSGVRHFNMISYVDHVQNSTRRTLMLEYGWPIAPKYQKARGMLKVTYTSMFDRRQGFRSSFSKM